MKNQMDPALHRRWSREEIYSRYPMSTTVCVRDWASRGACAALIIHRPNWMAWYRGPWTNWWLSTATVGTSISCQPCLPWGPRSSWWHNTAPITWCLGGRPGIPWGHMKYILRTFCTWPQERSWRVSWPLTVMWQREQSVTKDTGHSLSCTLRRWGPCTWIHVGQIEKCKHATRALVCQKHPAIGRWACSTVALPRQQDTTSCSVFVCKTRTMPLLLKPAAAEYHPRNGGDSVIFSRYCCRRRTSKWKLKPKNYRLNRKSWSWKKRN